MRQFENFQPLIAIATTAQAARTLTPLSQNGLLTLWVPASLGPLPHTQAYRGSLRDHLQAQWPQVRGVIFGLALGATVRLIAPLLRDKATDPAVLVVDAQGRHVLSVCGGHQGGADQLAQTVGALLQAQPILTGASACAQWPGLDTLGRPFGWHRGEGDWLEVSAAIARGQPVQVQQLAGSQLWRSTLPTSHPLNDPGDPDASATPAAIVWIHCQPAPPLPGPTVAWYPRVLWIGVGCERGSSAALIHQAMESVLADHRLHPQAIAGVASLDLKQDEAGLQQVCADHHWPLQCFSADTLAAIAVPNPSPIVTQAVGTPSVAEAAALQAAQQASQGLTDPPPRLLAPKQIFRQPGESGAVTVAIAQASREWIGRPGQLWLVGCGPGQIDQMTPAAQSAITQADVVIGYTLYLDLVRSRFRPGQIIEGSAITQEQARAKRAVTLAQWGLQVAVVSSGDAGIYGMAGLVMEELETQRWDGQAPGLEIFPGISALQAAAARVGTPLMHDFCAISLSDLLTPWPVIEQRLEAAATADFVTALYNPKSKTRQTQLQQAQNIFLAHRDPDTPVAAVRAAYRDQESQQYSTLSQLHTLDVDMLTLVLIGNQSTRRYGDWIITPRGYSGFQ
ncbi:precorrin-3B C(17)-methyltransferase [Lyngbya confervoides]|uniref:Precorrin-3B C(17)-methyltransferase n=1 Tax=Lyngbya confervoides BDU141951 TaxID=1574623 RepID=A0ABD4T2M8_9CYAN|nr:precorrin-3B C(17)-methyltransferase [Lyngbya confervoides]MCM1982865.1 precorrin-3B C(17)-methyltransferase [Lyngbya confervoides BDU141951]